MLKKSGILVLLIFMCFSFSSFAEVIVFKSGKTVEGKLLEKTDKYIKIDFEGVPLTYFFDEIATLNGQPVNIEDKTVVVEIVNPEYAKAPNPNENIEIDQNSSVEDILKKVNYYYASRDYDKAIELCKVALKKTDDRNLIAAINFSLSSNYLEKGIIAYRQSGDDSFYKLSIEYAKKTLEVFPYSWQTLGNLGSLYTNMKDYKQAVFYLSEAEKYIDKNNPNYAALVTARVFAEEMGKNK